MMFWDMEAAALARPSVRLLLFESGFRFGNRKRANDSMSTSRHVAGWVVLFVVTGVSLPL